MTHSVKFSKTHDSIDAKHKDLDRGLVQDVPIAPDGTGRFAASPGRHQVVWVAIGNPGTSYDAKVSGPKLKPNNPKTDGVIGTNRRDEGYVPFEVKP